MPFANLAEVEEYEKTPYEQRITASNVYDMLKQTAEKHAAKPAIHFLPKGTAEDEAITYTYRQFIERITQSANLFRALGVGPSDVVSLVMPILPETFFCLWGAEAAGIWETSGPQEPAPMASITKLITALVVLEAHPLAGPEDQGPTLWFDGADEDLYDAYYVQNVTIAPMPAGSSMSLRGALATMLIPSASNYADVVSTWAFGSRASFVSAARTWLDAHGLAGTTVVDPTGISARNTSTPADLIALGRIAAANPLIETRPISGVRVINGATRTPATAPTAALTAQRRPCTARTEMPTIDEPTGLS